MVLQQRHLEIGGMAVISHFTFVPPLVATDDLKNSGCFIFPVNTKGKLYRVDGKTEVNQHQGVLMKCGTYINKWYGLTDNSAAEVIILRLRPETMTSIFKSESIPNLKSTSNSKKTNVVVDIKVLLKSFIDGLFFYFENPELATEELVSLKIKELTLLLINSHNQTMVLELLYSLFEKKSYELKEIVEANVFENLSLGEMAAIANMSPTTFKRKFKACFNSTFSDYVNQKKLEKAVVLLKNPQFSISEVAYDCGFNDPGYFSKLFKRQYTMSPKNYRARL